MKWIAEQQVKLKRLADKDWKRMLNIGRLDVFGLDIGSSAVKIVQLQKNAGGYAVTAAGIADIYDEIVIEGNDEQRENNILNAIRQCLQSAGIQTEFAVCGVCGPEVMMRYFTFPQLLPEEINGAVLLEAKQVSPFNTDDGVVDYQLISSDRNSTNGILVATTNKLLKEKTKFIENAALRSILVDVDGLALLNCFRGCQTPASSAEPEGIAGQTTAILNVGSSYATLAIVNGDDLPFIRDLAYAGKTVIEYIASKSNVSAGTVESILTGRENPGEINSVLREGMETACNKLFADVTDTLRYYAVRKKSETIEKIYVCGGFALVDGFMDLLKTQFPAAVLWNPFEKISYDASASYTEILRKKGPALAVAAGLAMRAI